MRLSGQLLPIVQKFDYWVPSSFPGQLFIIILPNNTLPRSNFEVVFHMLVDVDLSLGKKMAEMTFFRGQLSEVYCL